MAFGPSTDEIIAAKLALKDMQDDAEKVSLGLSDQEIRARALECAVSIRRNIDPLADPDVAEQDFWGLAHKFEAYIRDGVT